MPKFITLIFIAIIFVTPSCKKGDKTPVDQDKEKTKMIIGNWIVTEAIISTYRDDVLVEQFSNGAVEWADFKSDYYADGTVKAHDSGNTKDYRLIKYRVSGSKIIYSEAVIYHDNKPVTDPDTLVDEAEILELTQNKMVLLSAVNYSADGKNRRATKSTLVRIN